MRAVAPIQEARESQPAHPTISDDLPTYMASSIMRKCPKCGDSKNYERSTTYAKETKCVNGVVMTWWFRSDAGHYRCLSCGYEASM